MGKWLLLAAGILLIVILVVTIGVWIEYESYHQDLIDFLNNNPGITTMEYNEYMRLEHFSLFVTLSVMVILDVFGILGFCVIVPFAGEI